MFISSEEPGYLNSYGISLCLIPISYSTLVFHCYYPISSNCFLLRILFLTVLNLWSYMRQEDRALSGVMFLSALLNRFFYCASKQRKKLLYLRSRYRLTLLLFFRNFTLCRKTTLNPFFHILYIQKLYEDEKYDWIMQFLFIKDRVHTCWHLAAISIFTVWIFSRNQNQHPESEFCHIRIHCFFLSWTPYLSLRLAFLRCGHFWHISRPASWWSDQSARNRLLPFTLGGDRFWMFHQ